VKYKRTPIEIESPEQFGYERIAYNLAESSVTDANLSDLEIQPEDLVLQYGDHKGKPELRELFAGESEELGPEDVLLTVGAAGALFIVATSLLDPGDHMVVAFPNYVTNIETPRAIGVSSLSESYGLPGLRIYRILNDTYRPFVGPGHWFESDRRFMRIGFGWPSKEELEGGLQNITRAIRDTREEK
jgi:DNA-binding transcriptional MocR family regulator